MNHFVANHWASNHWASNQFRGVGQAQEVYSGGYEYLRYIPFPRRKQVEDIVVDLVAKADYTEPPKKTDLEIGLRLRLAQLDLRYQKKILDLLYNEAQQEFKRREEEEITFLLLL